MHAVVTGLGIDVKNRHQRSCCFGASSSSLFIPFYNVLNASPTASGVRLSFVQPMRPHKLESLVMEIRKSRTSGVDEDQALNTADYGSDMFGDSPIIRKRFYVIINPHGGPGNADNLFRKFCKPIFDVAGVEYDIHYSTYSGHARDLAKSADLDGFDAIVCVSGDGTPYEVINGLIARNDGLINKLPVCQLPGGSGNALSHSVSGGDNFALNALNILKGKSTPTDLMCITQGTDVTYSFLSQSFGIVADCDLGTEDWRWMGPARFTLGVIIKTIARNTYPCKVAYKRQSSSTTKHKTPQYGTVNDELPSDWSVEVHPDLSMFYVGKLPFMSADALVFPHAKPNDGAMDLLMWDSSVGAIKGLQLLDKMQRGDHVGDKDIRYEKVVAYRLIPDSSDAYLSVDGEEYKCKPLQVEVLSEACLLVIPQGEYPLPKLV